MTPAEPLPRRVALCDANNFFVSCERIFRPDLAGRPVVVLSSNDGCVVSRSDGRLSGATAGRASRPSGKRLRKNSRRVIRHAP